MIKLNDVSTDRLFNELKYWKLYHGENNPKINELYSLLQSLNVTSYGDIKKVRDLLSMLDGRLDSIDGRIEYEERKGKKPAIYTFDTFKQYKVDDETVSKTDNNNKINDLLINNPARGRFEKQNVYVNRGMKLSVAQIKYLLGHIDERSMDNAFKTTARGFGEVKTRRVVDAINLYDKQLAKQYIQTGKRSRGENLLYVDWDEKSDIVLGNLRMLTECLLDSGNNFIWGELTDKDKIKILEAFKDINAEKNDAIMCNLINIFTKYNTLSELDQGIDKPHAVKKMTRKFIVK